MENKFLYKPIKLTKLDGFVLFGTVIAWEVHGVWFKTHQKTTFITFGNIKEISLDEKGGQ